MTAPKNIDYLAALEEESFQQSLLTVTDDDYTKAVEKLIAAVQMNTGQSRIAAQVLMSLYDSSEWHVGLVDLGCLDTNLFAAALIAIRGRIILGREPQNVIDDGDRRFARIWDNWQQYRIQERSQ